jgi:uncharacterized membrane protein YhiD involved in acid resistance
MHYFDFALRLALAFAFGALIGVERQWRQKLAGLRTNCLVSMGAALFVMLAALIPGDSSPSAASPRKSSPASASSAPASSSAMVSTCAA